MGWSDSFNRVAFHVLPLLFWLAGLTVMALVRGAFGETALAAADPAGPTLVDRSAPGGESTEHA